MIPIVIPSHQRADRVLTTKIVPSAIICVADSQREEYKEHNPNNEIVTHPDSVIGLVAKRNWMANHFKEVFFLDDDLTEFKKSYNGKGESCKVDKSEILLCINQLHSISKMLGISLFGFGNKITPVMYKETLPFTLNHAITGRSYGVICNENTKWFESFQLKEDFLISCWIMYKEGRVLVDNRYTFIQKDTMCNAGGLSKIRTLDRERENCIRLRQYFGEVVKLKKVLSNGQKTIQDKSKYNIVTKFR